MWFDLVIEYVLHKAVTIHLLSFRLVFNSQTQDVNMRRLMFLEQTGQLRTAATKPGNVLNTLKHPRNVEIC